jgi:hypothetical protein
MAEQSKSKRGGHSQQHNSSVRPRGTSRGRGRTRTTNKLTKKEEEILIKEVLADSSPQRGIQREYNVSDRPQSPGIPNLTNARYVHSNVPNQTIVQPTQTQQVYKGYQRGVQHPTSNHGIRVQQNNGFISNHHGYIPTNSIEQTAVVHPVQTTTQDVPISIHDIEPVYIDNNGTPILTSNVPNLTNIQESTQPISVIPEESSTWDDFVAWAKQDMQTEPAIKLSTNKSIKPTLTNTQVQEINNPVVGTNMNTTQPTAVQNTIVGGTDFSTTSMYLNGNSRPTSAFSEPVVLQQGLGSTDLGRALATRELLRAQEDTVPVPGPTQVNESIQTQPTQVVQAVQRPIQRQVVANKPQPRQVVRQRAQPTQPVYIPEPRQVQQAPRPTHKDRLAMLDSPSFGTDGAGIDW